MEIIIKDLMVVMTTLGKGQTVLWTSNSTVTKGGKAVCGRGFAKQLTEKYPGLKKLESMYLSGRKTIEERVDKYGNKVFLKEPTLHQVYCNYHNRKEVWAFPVKTAYWEKASLSIIEQNAKRLRELALDHMPEEFHINFPGIGAGELNYDEVLEVLERHWGDVPNIKVYKLQAQEKTRKFLTVIGSRTITKEEREELFRISKKYHDRGYTLRSGGANGADSIVNQFQNVEIIIPWNGFNGLRHDGRRIFVLDQLKDNERAKKVVIKIHPAPKKLSEGAMKLHMRNIYQITGVHGVHKRNLSNGVLYVADEHRGRVKGGTATAVHLAKELGIKVHNIR